MKYLYILFMFIYGLYLGLACPVYDCDSSLPEGVCYLQNEDDETVRVNNCSSEEVCEVNQMYSANVLDLTINRAYCVEKTYVSDLKYPGEECTKDNDCKYNTCNAGKCTATQEGHTCKEPEECDAGFTCIYKVNGGECRKQVQINDKCNSLYDCVNNGACFRGKCVEYFSLKKKSQFGIDDDANSLLCESGYYDSAKRCANPPKNKRRYNEACNKNSDCEVELKEENDKNGQCLCGMNTEGSAFCKSQPGDEEFLKFKAAMINLIKINQSCHSALAFSKRCKEISESYEVDDFLIAYYRYLYRHYLISQPGCVTDTITPFADGYDTNEYQESTEPDQTLMIIVLIVVFTIMAAICFICFIYIKRLMRSRSAIHNADSVNNNGRNRLVVSRIMFRDPSATELSAFKYDDLEEDDINTAYLTKGVPISKQVTYESFEDVEETIDYEEADMLNITTDYEIKPDRVKFSD